MPYCHSVHYPNKLNNLRMRRKKSTLSTALANSKGQFREKIEWDTLPWHRENKNVCFNFCLGYQKFHSAY